MLKGISYLIRNTLRRTHGRGKSMQIVKSRDTNVEHRSERSQSRSRLVKERRVSSLAACSAGFGVGVCVKTGVVFPVPGQPVDKEARNKEGKPPAARRTLRRPCARTYGSTCIGTLSRIILFRIQFYCLCFESLLAPPEA